MDKMQAGADEVGSERRAEETDAMMKELISNLEATRVSSEEAERLGDLGEQLREIQQDVNQQAVQDANQQVAQEPNQVDDRSARTRRVRERVARGRRARRAAKSSKSKKDAEKE